MTLEDQLSEALNARADQFEPSEDAFLQLKRRMAADVRYGRDAQDRNRLGPRLLAVAASLIVFVGVGAFVVQQRADNESVNVDGAATTIGPTGQPDEVGGADSASDGAAAVGADDSVDPTSDTGSGLDIASLDPAPAGVFGPRRTTWQAASLDFLELIQFESERATLEPAGTLVQVMAAGENGTMLPVTSLELGTTRLPDGSAGFVVVAATSPKATITSPTPRSTVTGSEVTVAGTGTGFEATLGVRLYSADDGVWLNAVGTQAGNFGELLPFEQRLSVAGRENAWIVVVSSTGSDAGIPEFAAEVVTINAPMPSATLTVSGIPLDDPDQGLVVRDVPGSAVGAKLFVLPAGFDQVQTRGLSANIDGQRWLNIWLPPAEAAAFDRKAGWVHSAYVTSGDVVDEATLAGIADEFIGAYKAGAVGFDQLPWSDRLIHVGWTGGLKVLGADELRSVDAWTADRDWLIPAERFGESVATAPLIEFVDSLGAAPAGSEFNYPSAKSFGTDPTKATPYGGEQPELASRFAGTSWVQFTDPASDGSEWQTTTLFVESTDDGPGIVGVVVTFWIP